jgi:hypothetical protein
MRVMGGFSSLINVRTNLSPYVLEIKSLIHYRQRQFDVDKIGSVDRRSHQAAATVCQSTKEII